jgi:hypothetical protein
MMKKAATTTRPLTFSSMTTAAETCRAGALPLLTPPHFFCQPTDVPVQRRRGAGS